LNTAREDSGIELEALFWVGARQTEERLGETAAVQQLEIVRNHVGDIEEYLV
jgi:hypothetical protein